jgi:hypothetical protein
VTRTPPVPAVVAAPLALISALPPGFFFLVALGFSGGQLSGLEWALLVVPLGLALGLVTGAVLLLRGRSWRVVTASGALLAVLVLGGMLIGDWAEGALGFGLATGLLPAAAAVLASSPAVRRWVAARQASA